MGLIAGGGGGLGRNGGAGGAPGFHGAGGGGGIGATRYSIDYGIVLGAPGGGSGGAKYYRNVSGSILLVAVSPGRPQGGDGGSGGYSPQVYVTVGSGGGGGVAGHSGATGSAVGGDGGFGGGGGGGTSRGGNGGFGGGGGGLGGAGGFGGGGGGGNYGSTTVASPGGYGAGAGGGGGGGGLGAGGDIFVMQGGSLTIGSAGLSGGAVIGGTPGPTAGIGMALGSGIFIQGTQSVDFSPPAGQAVTISDVIADDGDGSVQVGGSGTVVLDAANTYRGGSVIQNNATLELGTAGAAGSGAIAFTNGAAATLQIDGSTMPSNTIDGFAAGDTIVLANVAPAASTATLNANGQLAVPTTTGTVDLQIGLFLGLGFTLTARGNGTAITANVAPCFAAGTRIATPRGQVAVERLREGDTVLTVSASRQRIQWVGRRAVDCRRHPAPERVLPVRIAPHAFGQGRPARAVLLSPDHSVFVEDVLIPIKGLINDSTVAQIAVDTIVYYHIELPHHDVLLADGLPAESYLETGSRHAFENAGGAVQLHPEFEPDPARVAMVWQNFGYAPLLGDGSQLERAQQKLALQVELLAQEDRDHRRGARNG